MERTVNVGVIGCGCRAECLLSEIPGLGERIRIVACYDPNPAAARKIAEKFGPGATLCASDRELIARPDVEWVMIFSWNCFHRAQAVAALRAGKEVFCEKPLATTVADAVAMRRAHEASGRKFIIGFTLRYSPHYRTIREAVASGMLGQVISMEFNETLHFEHGGYIHGDWRRLEANAGPHLLEKCCHDVDLVHWILGETPRRVASFGGTNFFTPAHRAFAASLKPGPNGRPAYSGWVRAVDYDPFGTDKDVDDNQVAILEFPSGVRATFHTNCNSALYERRMYLCGSEGTLRADVVTGEILFCRIGHGEEPRRLDSGASGGHGGGDEVLGPSIAACMLDGAEPLSTLEDGLKAAVTCLGIDQAKRTGRVLEMNRLWTRAGLLPAGAAR